MEKRKNNKKETGEEATKYGEFVSSFFGWITPKHQKERAEELEKLGKQKKWQSVNWDRVPICTLQKSTWSQFTTPQNSKKSKDIVRKQKKREAHYLPDIKDKKKRY